MTEYQITVEMPVEVTFTINTDRVSDWDGRDLMHIHENGERWATGQPIPLDTALAYMATQIIDRGRLGGTDGFADFAEDATSFAWPQFDTASADVSVRTSHHPRNDETTEEQV